MSRATAVPVLMHHHVSPSTGMITVSPEHFESQIAWLANDGWTSLTLEQYAGFLAGQPVPHKSIVMLPSTTAIWITGSTHIRSCRNTTCMPSFSLSPAGLAMAQRVPSAGQSGAILPTTPNHHACETAILHEGRTDEVMLRWSEVQAMIAAGTFEAHCHTHTHTRWLTLQLSRAQRREGLDRDLITARTVLQQRLGNVSNTLCWPYGDFDADHIEIARAHGFRYFHTTHPFGRNVIGGNPEHIYRFALRNRPGTGCANASRSATTHSLHHYSTASKAIEEACSRVHEIQHSHHDQSCFKK